MIATHLTLYSTNNSNHPSMSSQISATLPLKSTLSGFDKVSNILRQKLPFEVVEIVFQFLQTTYIESIGANLEQLIYYSKTETFESLQNQLIDLNGAYKIINDGTVITNNIDYFSN